jgi:hypothetical protein
MSKQCCKKFIDKSKEFFFEKSLVFPPKMCKLSLTRQAASTNTQPKRKVENIMKAGKHSKIEKRSSGMPYGRGTGSKTV